MKTEIKIWFDGGCVPNPGKGYGSYEVQSPTLNHKVSRMEFSGTQTCNTAEYNSLIAALKWLRHNCKEPSQHRLVIFTDSLIVRNGIRKPIKKMVLHLAELCYEAKLLIQPYASFQIEWHGRDNNVERFGH